MNKITIGLIDSPGDDTIEVFSKKYPVYGVHGVSILNDENDSVKVFVPYYNISFVQMVIK